MSRKRSDILAWLEGRGWPTDPHLQSKDQNQAMRAELGICGARTRRGTPCGQDPKENGRCRMHGGNAKRGIAHYNFKDGGRSRYVPKPLLTTYEAAMKDADLLNMQADLALLEARLEQLLQKVDTGESGRMWHALRREFRMFRKALRADDEDEIRSRLITLETLITRGQGDADAWRDINSVLEQRRKAVETEARRRREMQEYIRAEDAAMHYRALALAVKRYVTDPDLLSEIADEFARVAGMANLPRAKAAELSG